MFCSVLYVKQASYSDEYFAFMNAYCDANPKKSKNECQRVGDSQHAHYIGEGGIPAVVARTKELEVRALKGRQIFFGSIDRFVRPVPSNPDPEVPQSALESEVKEVHVVDATTASSSSVQPKPSAYHSGDAGRPPSVQQKNASSQSCAVKMAPCAMLWVRLLMATSA